MMETTMLATALPLARRAVARGPLGLLLELDARWRARAHLAELDDRMLRDIGLTRADVAAELRRPLV
jgi:uncharacterized protein YjiS (DUF1127 family)